MDMLILFGVLVLGGLAGWRWRRVAWAVTWNRNLTKATIAVLLGVMGAKLALHRNLFAQDAGVFLLAVGSSLLLLLLFTGIFALAGLLRRHPKLEAHGDATGPGHGKAALRSVALNGGCIALGLTRFFPRWTERFLITVCAGIIAGESLVGAGDALRLVWTGIAAPPAP